MKKSQFKPLVLSAALAVLLSACGGGADSPSPTNSFISVTAATTASYNGLYKNEITGITDVSLVSGGTICQYGFSGLVKVGDSSSMMSGTIAYPVNTTQVSTASLTVGSVTFTTSGGAGTEVQNTQYHQVSFTNKVFTAPTPGVGTITVGGTVAAQLPRPPGC